MKKDGGARKVSRKSLGSMSCSHGKSSIADKDRRYTIADNDDSEQFEAFVQQQVKQQGFKLTEKEEKMVQEAIAKTKDDSVQFEAFVQHQVKRQGFKLTEDEEKMVQEAIAKTLSESKDSGVDLEDSSGESDVEDGEELDDVFD